MKPIPQAEKLTARHKEGHIVLEVQAIVPSSPDVRDTVSVDRLQLEDGDDGDKGPVMCVVVRMRVIGCS